MWVKGTLRYLLDTSTVGFISGGPTPGPKLLGYADAGFADCTVTRRSRGGFVFLPLSGTVTVASATATIVVQSTAESRHIALASAAYHAVSLRRLVDLTVPFVHPVDPQHGQSGSLLP